VEKGIGMKPVFMRICYSHEIKARCGEITQLDNWYDTWRIVRRDIKVPVETELLRATHELFIRLNWSCR